MGVQQMSIGPPGGIWDNATVKWLAGLAQLLLGALLIGVCSVITGSIDAVGKKVDGVLESLNQISQEQAVQRRDLAQMDMRQGRTESKVELLEQTSLRLVIRLEQIEKVQANGK